MAKNKNRIIRNIKVILGVVISIAIIIGVPALLFLPSQTLSDFLKKTLNLEYWEITAICIAVVSLIWTAKRYNQTQEQLGHTREQLKQNQNFSILNKLNTMYLELVKLLSEEGMKRSTVSTPSEDNRHIRNLINGISSILNTHYGFGTDERQEYARQILNFSAMDLSNINLSKTNLSKTNLSKADLSKADLSEADLSEADLREADLSEADLREADLHGADLSEADLSWADLRGADLSGAKINTVNKQYIEIIKDSIKNYDDIIWMDNIEADIVEIDI